ncbi:MAG: M20/M25/M40 family metallo-hydrolase [Gemmatimonadales bacterium]
MKQLTRRSLTWALALIAIGSAPGAAQAPAIDQATVERVLRTLASDEMEGRDAYTPAGQRAADFLVREFQAAGLQSPPGAEGYLQRFSTRTLTVGTGRVVVNGRQLQQGQIAMRLGSGSIEWRTGDVPVVIVGPDEDPLVTVTSVANAGFDALVLIDESHREGFTPLLQIFRRPVRVLASAQGAAVVLGLVTADENATYQVSHTANVVEEPLANVVGMLPGRRTDEFVLFSAHYDHIGFERPLYGDSIANGANDNASGVAAIVALAKYYASRGTPERTLLFAAFTAEEAGGFGARYYSRQLDPDQIVAMFNIEMIGKPAAAGPNTAWITGFDKSSFGQILQQAVAGTGYQFLADPYPRMGLFTRSDNATLARLGVPAHSISTTPIDNDPDYHRVTDEIDTVDIPHIMRTVQAIARGSETIVSGEATPTRVDPATVD